MTPEAIANRLADYSARLRTGSLTRVRALWTIWQSYNDAQNPRRAKRFPKHASAVALNLMASSTLHESIIILVRAFDRRGHHNLFRTDKVSFPVMAELARQPGVRDELEQRARRWLPDDWRAAENARACVDAIDSMLCNLDRLAQEQPNRQQRLRDFRDEFLAHNLQLEEARDRPIYGDITSMISEFAQLVGFAELAFSGNHVDWYLLDDQVRTSAEALWSTIRHGADTRIR